MSKPGVVNIHGKEYVTVAKRLEMAHEEAKLQGVKTEVLQYDPVVVVRATVNIGGIEYQGISSANPMKSIEKSNPFEVAETSAVGRALGFAGFGLVESVATADDMVRAMHSEDYSAPANRQPSGNGNGHATEKQINVIRKLLKYKGFSEKDLMFKYDVTEISQLTLEQASVIIENLMKLPDKSMS